MFSSLLSLSFIVAVVFATPLTPNSVDLARRAATVYTKCTKPNTVALTFDDGPYIYLHDIVDKLDAAGVKGTFFFNGNNWDCIYNAEEMDGVKYAYNKGHMVGSHTWAHKNLTKLTRDQIDSEMQRVEQALERIIGVKPAFMRPPYGSYNQLVLDVAGARGQGVVLWDFDSRDSEGASVATSNGLYDQVIKKHPDTILTLNHETYKSTADEVLPYALSKLKGAGYKLVTVAECLGLSPYQSVGKPQTPQSDWKC